MLRDTALICKKIELRYAQPEDSPQGNEREVFATLDAITESQVRVKCSLQNPLALLNDCRTVSRGNVTCSVYRWKAGRRARVSCCIWIGT